MGALSTLLEKASFWVPAAVLVGLFALPAAFMAVVRGIPRHLVLTLAAALFVGMAIAFVRRQLAAVLFAIASFVAGAVVWVGVLRRYGFGGHGGGGHALLRIDPFALFVGCAAAPIAVLVCLGSLVGAVAALRTVAAGRSRSEWIVALTLAGAAIIAVLRLVAYAEPGVFR
ncbi:MAG TPA: hypothetical protein VFM29_04040 [Vicinamibacteria bacterium]|nr:hypothetical protein [Vicinamibacteria bacterium]